jgi:hypothetical protein
MSSFKDCICIAQARLISGRKSPPHICTLAYYPHEHRFLRVRLPFDGTLASSIRRWQRFSFEGEKIATDVRKESLGFVKLKALGSMVSDANKRELHRQILSSYKPESELNQNRDGVGILIPKPGSLRFHVKQQCQQEEHYRQNTSAAGLYYPDKEIYVSCRAGQFSGRSKKLLLAWDAIEALRKGNNPFPVYEKYKHPYMLVGNHYKNKRAFMVIGILSAPAGFIDYAFSQQLALAV